MTDVIGFLPTDSGDPREAELCADYNADSIEKRERFPRLRDLSMFIGSFDELPDCPFGPGLPEIRSWSRRWFSSVPADDLAAAMRTTLAQNGTGPGYRKVPRGGADRAAARIAALLAGQ